MLIRLLKVATICCGDYIPEAVPYRKYGGHLKQADKHEVASVVRQKSFNIILPRSDRMGQEGGAEGIAKLRSGFWKAFRARPITIKTRGTIAQWRLL